MGGDWLDRFFSRVGLGIAIAMPIAVFLVLDLAIQLIALRAWGSTGSLARWEWSALVIPLLAFIPGYFIAIVAVAGQMKRLGWWRPVSYTHLTLPTICSV